MPSTSYANSHYAYIEKHGKWFSDQLGVEDINKIVVAHGDKSRQYFDLFEKLGVSPKKGAMVHLLTYVTPYSNTVRQTSDGWVSVESWLTFAVTLNLDIVKLLNKLPD